MTQKPYANPFENVPDEETRRLNADVRKDVYDFFRSIRLTNGTMQTTTNILLLKLHDELRKRNITNSTDVDAFEHFVANCELTLPIGATFSAPGGTPDKADVSHDRGGVEGVHSEPAREHTKHGVVGQESVRGKKRTKGAK